MDASGLILLIALGLLLWFWANTLRVRELAIKTARETCARQHLQFLDATVVLHRLSLQRESSGKLTLQRTFLFAYSDNGEDRRTGFIVMLGNHVEQVGL